MESLVGRRDFLTHTILSMAVLNTTTIAGFIVAPVVTHCPLCSHSGPAQVQLGADSFFPGIPSLTQMAGDFVAAAEAVHRWRSAIRQPNPGSVCVGD